MFGNPNDSLGNPINIGDHVAYATVRPTDSKKAMLKTGHVTEFKNGHIFISLEGTILKHKKRHVWLRDASKLVVIGEPKVIEKIRKKAIPLGEYDG